MNEDAAVALVGAAETECGLDIKVVGGKLKVKSD